MSLTLISPYSILLDKGSRLEKAGQYLEAASIYMEATEQANTHNTYSEKDRRIAMLNSAVNYRRIGGTHTMVAMEIFDNLLLEPDDDLTNEIKREKSIALIQENKADKAIELLDKMFNHFSNSASNLELGAIFSSVAMAKGKLGKENEAIYNFEIADAFLRDSCSIHELNNLIRWIKLLNLKKDFR